MKKNLGIRRVRKEDLKELEIEYKYLTDRYYDIVNKDGNIGLDLEAKSFNKKQTRLNKAKFYPNYIGKPLVYELSNGGKPVGYLQVEEGENQSLKIWEILILDKFRLQGLGTLLIKVAKSLAQEKNYKEILLETPNYNYPIIRTCIKNGFRLKSFDSEEGSDSSMDKAEFKLGLVYIM